MNRRTLLKRVAALPLLRVAPWQRPAAAAEVGAAPVSALHRNRPSDSGWPSEASWQKLRQKVGGRLLRIEPPFAACDGAAASDACGELFRNLKNPYYINAHPGLTQTTGWVDGWVSAPSAYAVAAKEAGDVVAAVKFAGENNLRLVVKGGGHSYQGTSNAPDSLLIWTREMNGITLHDEFVGGGCGRKAVAQPAVTVEAGAIWMHVYNVVAAKAGRYVQGGGCATVGVAGLIQSGGFGSFSKNYGMAAAALLEAEIVTADGKLRIANACTNADLFWALKGGGGGSFGVVTKLTLRTRLLPDFFGGILVSIKAASDAAYRRLIARFVDFYSAALFNRHWGEQVSFQPSNELEVFMLFHDLDQQQASEIWQPFLDWLAESPQDFTIVAPPKILAIPARNFWDPDFLRSNLPGMVRADDRPGAPAANLFWAGNLGECGQFLYGYESLWLPAVLLRPQRQQRLVDAFFAGSRHWRITLHFNKGLAGAPGPEIDAAKDTATNPAVVDAFALAISASSGPPAYPGVAGRAPDVARGREHRAEIARAMKELRQLVPNPGSYLSEADFFDAGWQRSYWGPNYPRLSAVKRKYDPAGLFIVHHGVGSEEWSADGFTRLAQP